jgi:hypothetical protein
MEPTDKVNATFEASVPEADAMVLRQVLSKLSSKVASLMSKS